MSSSHRKQLFALTLFAAMTLTGRLVMRAQQQHASEKLPSYIVTDLGPAQSFAEGINNRGWVTGTAVLADGVTQHAFLWREGIETDLGTFGGPNSSAFNLPSERGQVAGNAETSTPDPLGEDFCLYGTHLICLGFSWQNGVITPLATLGGNNSWANGGMNNRGQAVGVAENATLDPSCATPGLEGRPVIWEKGAVQELPTFPGDEDGTALSINDRGQVVGVSTDCNALPTIFHAVLWRNGTVIDLGSLGGTLNNVAQGINNRGQVVGFSDLPGDTSSHAFLWTDRDGMRDLGTFGGLPTSLAFGINDEGQVVGMSCDVSFDCSAFLWQDGVMTELNTLLPQGSPWNLIVGTSINARGEIVGVGDTGNGFHAVLLTPCDQQHADAAGCKDEGTATPQGETSQGSRSVLSENFRKILRQRLSVRYRSPDTATPQAVLVSAPNATLSPTSLTFSTQAIGTTSAAKTVTLKNTGTTALTISGIAITGTNGGDFAQTQTCGSSLTAGASCTISVTFKPTVSGTRTSALSITDNAAGSPQKVPLSGIATTAKLSPTRLNFGSVTIGTTSPAETVTLTNVGTTTLTITGITITGRNAGDFSQTHTCGSSLAAGASCSISVTFKPTAYGLLTAALSISDNAAGSPQTVTLTGGCIPQGGLCFGPAGNHCCRAPRGHFSFCSNPTGWGTCTES